MLTAERFQATVGASKAAGGVGVRRRSPRITVEARATIIPCSPASDRRQVVVSVRDVSADGIGLLYHQPMANGQQFILVLPSAAGAGTKAILCTAAWWQPMGEQSFAVGARFGREIDGSRPQRAIATEDADDHVRELNRRLAKAAE
jgi:hypothetical protein